MNKQRLLDIIEKFNSRPWKQHNQLTENGCLLWRGDDFDNARRDICYSGFKRADSVGLKATTASPEKFEYYGWTKEEVEEFVAIVSAFHPQMAEQFAEFAVDSPVFVATATDAIARFSGWCLARLLWESPNAAAYLLYVNELSSFSCTELQQLTASQTPGVHGYMGNGVTLFSCEELGRKLIEYGDASIGSVDTTLGCRMSHFTHNSPVQDLKTDIADIREWLEGSYGDN